MKQEKYISPVILVVPLGTSVTIAATSSNINDFGNNPLEYEEL